MRSLFLKIFLWFWATQILIGIGLSILASVDSRGRDQEAISQIGDQLEARARAAAIAYEAGGKPSLKALKEAWDAPRRRFRGGVGRGYNARSGAETGVTQNSTPDEADAPPPPPPDDEGGPPSGGDGLPDGGPSGSPGAPPEGMQNGGWWSNLFTGNTRRNRFRPYGRGWGGDRDPEAFYALRGSSGALVPERLAGPQQPVIFTAIKANTFVNGAATVKQSDGTTWLARAVTTPRGGQYMAVKSLSFIDGRPTMGWSDWLTSGPGGRWRIVVITLTMGVVCYALARYLTAPAIKLRRATQEFANGNLSIRVAPQMGKRRDELADLGRDFDVMAERIENLRLSERRLLADISHELRSPLARMQVALDLADQGADEETRGYLLRIEDEAKELNGMIGQLLTITRLESASPGDQIEENVDLAHLVTQVCANADFEAKSHGSKVELVENAPCHIRGNGKLLRSAIENVVRNAILHAPTAQGIQISLQVLADAAKIQVRDHGPGVPPESLSELFRPFYRVAEDRDRKSGGVGLGLSITQRAVQLHGGKVNASNAPGGGLLVEMTLPLSVN